MHCPSCSKFKFTMKTLFIILPLYCFIISLIWPIVLDYFERVALLLWTCKNLINILLQARSAIMILWNAIFLSFFFLFRIIVATHRFFKIVVHTMNCVLYRVAFDACHVISWPLLMLIIQMICFYPTYDKKNKYCHHFYF